MIALSLPFAVEQVASWLGTFALHSTCILVFACLLSLALGRRGRSFQERLLRFSLWAAVVSSSVQLSWFGSGTPFAIPMPTSEPELVALSAPREASFEAPAMVHVPSAPAVRASKASVAAIATCVAGGLAVLGLAWLAITSWRLRCVLARRQPEVDPRVLATAAEAARALGWRQTPQLSRCDDLATPIAFGWIRPEICLPLRAAELSTPSLRALLAHELAHLRAGDATWMWCGAWLQALFPWQVLLPVVRRRWTNLVELRCDAEAARHATPTAVATCLLDVAEWLRTGERSPAIALGMAARPSSLRQRVEAALQPQDVGPPRRVVGVAFAGLSLTALATAAPGVHCAAHIVPTRGEPVDLAALATADGPGATALEAPPDELGREVSAVELEYAALLADVEEVHARLDASDDPELGFVLTALDERLQTLADLRDRLIAKLGNRSNQPR